MTIISSQHYIDETIVKDKVLELKNSRATSVVIPCTYVGLIDGEEYALVADKHHTMAAARELNLKIDFDVQDDSEGLTGDDLLLARYIDGDYYNVLTSDPRSAEFDLIW